MEGKTSSWKSNFLAEHTVVIEKQKLGGKAPVFYHTIHPIMKTSYLQAAEFFIQIWADLRYTLYYMKAAAVWTWAKQEGTIGGRNSPDTNWKHNMFMR